MQNLVIVESPTKARTLSKFLGSKYQIEASMGHVRDLPKSDLGIDVDDNFEPKYIIPKAKTKAVNALKKLAKDAKTLWLATDPDREGEAIAWHLAAIFGKAGHRVVFHEITPEAIEEAFENPRTIDQKLVDAQQARRVLDRLVGYKLSPVLWKKVKSGLSAGRVQSVALRLIVEREKEITAFKPVEYWSIEAELQTATGPASNNFTAALIEKDGKKLAVKNEKEAKEHEANLQKAEYKVFKITKKEVRKHPAPPFTTSTLQQNASLRLGMTAKKTMMLAQFLYEHGLITYMRTDSVNLAPVALNQARSFIEQNFGKSYLPPKPRLYKTKSKLAQEAHEAIRPTNIKTTVEQLKTDGITRDHIRLYELIWKRMLASQMNEAVYDHTTVDVAAGPYLLRATGALIKFDGWLKLYGKVASKKDQEVEEDKELEQVLPELSEGEILKLLQLLPAQHFTEPPARFNEASLIKKLEELGIGRPSTYAPIISTILERYYIERKERKFFPTELGNAVIEFLLKNFSNIIDYDFTAQLEDELDEIAHGEREWKPTIAQFYKPFEEKIEKVEETADKVKIAVEKVDKQCPKCGKDLVVRFGRFGKFLACSGFPDCKHTEPLEEKLNIKCPDCGGDVVLRRTKKGRPFYGCSNYPNCKFASWNKPKGLENSKTT